jgi:hypothetical protein
MIKRIAELLDTNGAVVAIFNEVCHPHGTTAATVRLRGTLSPFQLQGTESLAIYAKGMAQPVLTVEASDPAGTEICEFHGTSAVGCVPEGTTITLIRSPGGDLSTLLIVMASGTVKNR